MKTIFKWLHNRYILGFLVGSLAIFDLILWGFAADLNKSEWASWVQGVGTIIAIAAAFLVADRQVTHQRRQAAVFVLQMFHPVAFALDELAFVYGPPSRPHRGDGDAEPDVFDVEKWIEVADHAGFVLDHYDKFKSRIHRYEAGLNLLSAVGLRTALALETELEDTIRDAVTRLKIRPHNYVPGGTVEHVAEAPTWSSRFVLAVSNGHVQDYMARLEREAS
jgi:hypothetical protein